MRHEEKTSIRDYDANKSRVDGDIRELQNQLGIENVLDRVAKLEDKVRTITKSGRFETSDFGAFSYSRSYYNKRGSKSSYELETHPRSIFCANVLALLQSLQEEVDREDAKSDDFTKDITEQRKSNSSFIIDQEIAGIILDKIKTLSTRLQERGKKNDDLEEDEEVNFSEDCYSMIALNGPINNHWPRDRMLFFFFGFNVFLFQFAFLVLMIWSRMDPAVGDIESDNPSETFLEFVPSNSKNMIRAAQIVSILAYTLFPESSLMEIFRAYQYFPFSEARKNDPNWCIRLSCILRGIQGYMATLAVFLVLITSDTVVDIILNFTALNFISGLDDDAFSLARSGIFGTGLKKEAKRIEEEKLPLYVTRKSKLAVHWGVMGSTAAVLFLLLALVMIIQMNTKLWVTKTVRVGFRNDDALAIYNGCYGANRNPRVDQRRTYSSLRTFADASFGYCEEDARWILFEGEADEVDPCEAGEREIARSAVTGDFDISSSFEISWFYPSSRIALNLFFEGGSTIDDLNCEMVLGDGICDDPFNEPEYDYDGGDCCAATCAASYCGMADFTSAFGSSNISQGRIFPNCRDPQMYPITIKLNELTSSGDEKYGLDPCFFAQLHVDETEWRAIAPVAPDLYLSCNGDYVLSLSPIEKSMENHTETVFVEDGATCQLEITNSTFQYNSDTKTFQHYEGIGANCNAPIWFVNYTVFHGEIGTESDGLEILTDYSNEKDVVRFHRIPECYVENLKGHVDLASFYEASSSSSKAIDWLEQDTSGNSDCENESFIERFALVAIEFATKKNATWATTEPHCMWNGITCDYQGSLIEIDLPNRSLQGAIPSEIKLLSNLEGLYLYENELTSIASEMFSLTELKVLNLSYNNFSSIPKQLAQLTNLEQFTFDRNKIGSMPSEVWQLSNLQILTFSFNDLNFLPSEIGLLTNLEWLSFDYNAIKSIPTEIGLINSMNILSFWNTNIISIPSEIGLMKDLLVLSMGQNQITSFPNEIGQLKKLELVTVSSNRISSIPSAIFTVRSLKSLELDDNLISLVPSEIGLLTNLRLLDLSNNQITTLPTEIGLLTNLLHLSINDNAIAELPTEIGLLTALKDIKLFNNNIKNIPIEIEPIAISSAPEESVEAKKGPQG